MTIDAFLKKPMLSKQASSSTLLTDGPNQPASILGPNCDICTTLLLPPSSKLSHSQLSFLAHTSSIHLHFKLILTASTSGSLTWTFMHNISGYHTLWPLANGFKPWSCTLQSLAVETIRKASVQSRSIHEHSWTSSQMLRGRYLKGCRLTASHVCVTFPSLDYLLTLRCISTKQQHHILD